MSTTIANATTGLEASQHATVASGTGGDQPPSGKKGVTKKKQLKRCRFCTQRGHVMADCEFLAGIRELGALRLVNSLPRQQPPPNPTTPNTHRSGRNLTRRQRRARSRFRREREAEQARNAQQEQPQPIEQDTQAMQIELVLRRDPSLICAEDAENAANNNNGQGA